MKHLTISIIICAISINLGFSQSRFSKSQLIADLDTLYSVINEVHPDMFAVMTQDKFEKKLNEIKSNLKDSMTVFDFYIMTAPLIHDLEDGHTLLFPPSYLFPPLENEIHNPVFPFFLSVNAKDSSIIVLKDLSGIEPIIPEGSRMKSFNNHTDKETVIKIAKYMSGEKFSFRIVALNNYFPILLPVLLPVICQDTVFNINYVTDGKTRSKMVKSVPAEDIKKNFISETSSDSQDEKDNYKLEINEELNTAIIRFDAFDLNDYVNVFLDSAFSLIKEKSIEHLIIDLRYNGGGNSNVGDEFFQYISPVPFKQFGTVHIKISNRLKKYQQEPYGDKKDTIIVNKENEELIPLRENPLRYTGKVYLLTSDYTFSSAADFAWAFSYFKMGTIVGEETGGLIVCFGDAFDIFRLSNTDLRYKVSYKKFYGYGATDKHTHGVIPDIEVSAEQAMKKVFELIRNCKGK